MQLRLIFLRLLFGLALASLAAGCVSSGPRNRYLEEIDPASLPHLSAFLNETNLEIVYPTQDHDAYAVATWPGLMPGKTNYQYCYAVLAFDAPSHGVRRSLLKQGHPLAVRDAKQWQSLVDEVFQGLMPKEAGHGVLVQVQNQQIAIYRDRAGGPRVVKLDQKPGGIVIDKALSPVDFEQAAIERLEVSAHRLGPGQRQFLFVTEGESAFVLIDLQQRLIVFLSYPLDPEAQPAQLPGWFTLRALNSLVWRGFVVSAIKNPFTMIGRGLWQFGTSGATALDIGSLGSDRPPPPLHQGPGMDLAAWEKELDGLVPERRIKGHLQLLINGSEFFPALIRSIENATTRIDILVYIFGRDYYAVGIADLLKERSWSVPVRVLIDEMGSLFGGGQPPPVSLMPPGFTPPRTIKTYLTKEAKVEVRASANPWLTTDHRKCIIIDSREAYVGGMNIGWQYRYEWHDLMVRLTGPIVGRLERDYDQAWAHAGLFGDFGYAWVCLFGGISERKNEIKDGIDIRTLRTSTGRMEILRAQLEAIERARSYIYLENAYFSDDSILRALIKARQRGVDVRVVLPAKNDSGMMQINNLLMANEMVRHGIRVYAYPGMTHVKAAIIDGWACVGSANLEKMSLRVSQELDLAYSDPSEVTRLRHDLFEADFARAEEITSPVPSDWMDPLVKAFAGQF